MAKTHYKIKDKLVEQAIKEIEFAKQYRRKRETEWKKNDEIMRGYQEADESTRTKVPLYQAIAFEETLLSKIDNSLVFKFVPGGLEDKRKAQKFNALRERDAKVGRWDKRDRQGKRHGIRYGRVIFSYFATSEDGEYKPNLNNIRPRHFLIDPDAGGLDKELAMYMGWYGVKKTKAQLETGVKKGIYDKKAVEDLILAGSNYNMETQEDLDERNSGMTPDTTEKARKRPREDLFMFYQWFTTDENGERYILLLTPSGKAVRCQKWKEIEPTNLYPIWTWATTPDDREFWSISPLERVRRMMKAQEKSIAQMMDNADQVNKPKMAVNVDFVRNLSQVKYGTKGFIEITGQTDVDKVVKAMATPPIDSPLLVYDKLQQLQDRFSGVTADAAGVTDTDAVLGVQDNNLANLGDRIGLLNKEYSDGYYDFAVLYKSGVRTHLTGKVAIRILGPNGLGVEQVSWADLDPTGEDYDIIIESSSAESQANKIETKNKLTVLGTAKGDPLYNQRVVREKELELSGFSEDDKRALLDTKDGSEGMVVLAYEDFEKFLNGNFKDLVVPRNANLTYLQVLKDLWEERDQMIDKMFKKKAPLIHQEIESFIAEVQAQAERNIAMDAALEEAKQVAPEQETKGGRAVDTESIEDPTAVGTVDEPVA